MKRTLLTELPEKLPEVIRDFMRDAPVYDSSCSPQARVYYVERDGGYFVKTSAPGTLQREATLASYFHGKGLGAEVPEYFTGESDWMITARVKGEDCTHGVYLEDPRRLCDLLGETLRRLHEIDPADCPVQDRNLSYLALAEENYRTGNYDSSHFPDSFGYASAEQAHRVLMEEGGRLAGRVLLHGDYCLPNVMLDNWNFSGFIDLGNGGVGDRHIDLFWGTWSLAFNLKTDQYRQRFFDAYGRDLVDKDTLRVIAAAEVFG